MARSKLSWSLIFLALYMVALATVDSATAQSFEDALNEAAKKAAADSQKAADQQFDQWKASHPGITPECANEYNHTVTTYLNSLFDDMLSPNYNSSVNSTAAVEQYVAEAEKNLTTCVKKAGGSLNSASVFGFNNVFALVAFVALLFLFV